MPSVAAVLFTKKSRHLVPQPKKLNERFALILHLHFIYICNHERYTSIQDNHTIKHAYNELPGNRDFPLL